MANTTNEDRAREAVRLFSQLPATCFCESYTCEHWQEEATRLILSVCFPQEQQAVCVPSARRCPICHHRSDTGAEKVICATCGCECVFPQENLNSEKGEDAGPVSPTVDNHQDSSVADALAELREMFPMTKPNDKALDAPERIWIGERAAYLLNEEGSALCYSQQELGGVCYVRADASGWQDIESAPKDGTWQVVARIIQPSGIIWWERARWNTKHSQWRTHGGPCDPTHYLPLPPFTSKPTSRK